MVEMVFFRVDWVHAAPAGRLRLGRSQLCDRTRITASHIRVAHPQNYPGIPHTR